MRHGWRTGPAALIQPNFEFVIDWANKKGISIPSDPAELVKNPEVINRISEEIEKANKVFAKWEKIKQFRLTPEVWSIDLGHLTPTMKLKRKFIKERYIDLYNDIYSE